MSKSYNVPTFKLNITNYMSVMLNTIKTELIVHFELTGLMQTIDTVPEYFVQEDRAEIQRNDVECCYRLFLLQETNKKEKKRSSF